MKTRNLKTTLLGTVLLFLTSFAFAHPTGNMVTIGENVLWSYINPINDPNHHACVMIWTKGSEPKVFIQSEYAASDFMLYTNQNELYILERRFMQTSDEFQVRILKSTISLQTEVIWDWFKDNYRIGEGGFFMPSDSQIVFAKYPEVYYLDKGKEPIKDYFEVKKPINGLRAVENNQFLLTDENSCWLVNQKGKILKTWNNLLIDKVVNAPLNRNRIFDVDYHNGELLMAYWGKRSFETISNKGERKVIYQLEEPYTPHWVSFLGNKKLLFSSQLVFDGSTPKPHLTLIDELNNQSIIWSTQ